MYGSASKKQIVYVKNGICTENFRFEKEIRRKMRECYRVEEELIASEDFAPPKIRDFFCRFLRRYKKEARKPGFC